jgi:hypothetical protein
MRGRVVMALPFSIDNFPNCMKLLTGIFGKLKLSLYESYLAKSDCGFEMNEVARLFHF